MAALPEPRYFEKQFSVCDNLVSQFALASELGRQFSNSWFNARQVLALGRRAAKPNDMNPVPPHPRIFSEIVPSQSAIWSAGTTLCRNFVK
jgi:hypothetical protein